MIELIYTGRDFYNASGTVIGALYQVVGDELRRFDWGFTEIALERGEEIHIRPANQRERAYFRMKVEEINARVKQI